MLEIIIMLAIAAGGGAFVWRQTETPQRTYRRHHRALQADMDRRSVPIAERTNEILFRHAMARVQRRASKVLVPGRQAESLEAIGDLAIEEARTLQAHDPALARRFAKTFRDLKLQDIVTEHDFWRIVGKPNHRRPHVEITEDHINAMKTR